MTNVYTGLLYLPKAARPRAGTTAAGQFQLTLPLRDRQAHLQVEPWLAVWTGPEAQAFWQRHADQLVPGTPLAVTLTHLRPHGAAGRFGQAPEIHAQVQACALAPQRWAGHPTTSHNTTHHPETQ